MLGFRLRSVGLAGWVFFRLLDRAPAFPVCRSGSGVVACAFVGLLLVPGGAFYGVLFVSLSFLSPAGVGGRCLSLTPG